MTIQFDRGEVSIESELIDNELNVYFTLSGYAPSYQYKGDRISIPIIFDYPLNQQYLVHDEWQGTVRNYEMTLWTGERFGQVILRQQF